MTAGPTRAGVAGVAGAVVGGAAAGFAAEQLAEARLREVFTELVEQLRAEVDTLTRQAIAEVDARRAEALAEVEAVVAQTEPMRAELEAVRIEGESSLRATADSATADLELQSTEARHALQESGVELDARLRQQLDEGLSELVARADQVRGELDGGLRQAVESVEAQGGRLREVLELEGQQVRDRKIRLRAALEDVVQGIVSVVPGIGPALAHVADRIDPYE